jgi:hypothetical protein
MKGSQVGGRKGRDDERNQDRQGRGNDRSRPQAPSFKGADLSLPTMFYSKSGNPFRWNKFIEGLKVYARKQFILGLDNICDPVEPKYPVIKDPELDAALVASVSAEAAEQVRIKEILRAREQRQKLEEDKVKFHAVIVGQLAPSSKEQLRSMGDGLDALEGSDPLKLLNQIRITHMQGSRRPALLNLVTAVRAFYNCNCRHDQTLDSYKSDLEAMMLQLADAITKADAGGIPSEYEKLLPNEATMAAKFVDGLPSSYGAYKQKVEREELSLPPTVGHAYDAANKHGQQHAPSHVVDRHAMAAQVKGNKQGGGPPVAGKDGSVLDKSKGKCKLCQKFGHHRWNCPTHEEKDKDNDVVAKTVKSVKNQEN